MHQSNHIIIITSLLIAATQNATPAIVAPLSGCNWFTAISVNTSGLPHDLSTYYNYMRNDDGAISPTPRKDYCIEDRSKYTRPTLAAVTSAITSSGLYFALSYSQYTHNNAHVIAHNAYPWIYTMINKWLLHKTYDGKVESECKAFYPSSITRTSANGDKHFLPDYYEKTPAFIKQRHNKNRKELYDEMGRAVSHQKLLHRRSAVIYHRSLFETFPLFESVYTLLQQAQS